MNQYMITYKTLPELDGDYIENISEGNLLTRHPNLREIIALPLFESVLISTSEPSTFEVRLTHEQ